jgi:hypothetical protein
MEEVKTPPKKFNKKFLILAGVLLALIFLMGTVAVLARKQSEVKTVDEKSATQSEDGATPVLIGEVTNDQPLCSLPVVEYAESAFSIGVPNGWIYEVSDGTVSIMQDDTNTTAAFLYTAKLDQKFTSEEFINLFSEIFNSTITEAGGTFAFSLIEADDKSANGMIAATLDGVDMKGKMMIDKTPDFVTLKSYWAPVQSLDSEEPVLTEITNCFARQRIINDDMLSAVSTKDQPKDENVPSGFRAYNGKYFSMNKPDNFSVTGETDSGIDLTRSDGNAGFSYAYVTGATGNYTPKSWAEKALPEYVKISQVQFGASKDIPSPINGQSVAEYEFNGMLNGYTPVSGKITVGILNVPNYGVGTQYFSAFWGIQLATPQVWPSAKATLQTIQDSFQIKDIGSTRKNTLLPPNRPIESTGGSSITSNNSAYSDSLEKSSEEKWSDAMRGYETVTSPTTGENYDVPQNSWSSYGPEGPGYYRQLPDDSLERLE